MGTVNEPIDFSKYDESVVTEVRGICFYGGEPSLKAAYQD